jgi:hypothetical protein
MPFQGFMINQVRRTVCSNDVGAYACGSLAGDRITQAGQVSAEEPDKEGPMRGKQSQSTDKGKNYSW